MKMYYAVVVVFVLLLLMPFPANAQAEQTQAPPVSQPLVAEGTFALRLVPTLGLGEASTEAQAEDILASVGISPKNGWITDYPVTPAVIGEVRDSIAAASDSQRFRIQKDKALKSFDNLTSGLALSVSPESGTNPEYQSTNVNPGVIYNYYYNQGPPVVTYYPPPWDYDYLYSWYPYPFYSYGFFFPGYYVLNDFAFYGGLHGHLFVNHFGDREFHNRLFFNRFGNQGFRGFNSPVPRIWDFRNRSVPRIWDFGNRSVPRIWDFGPSRSFRVPFKGSGSTFRGASPGTFRNSGQAGRGLRGGSFGGRSGGSHGRGGGRR
jgi:hypothetical protein